jgi:hypothetical protein
MTPPPSDASTQDTELLLHRELFSARGRAFYVKDLLEAGIVHVLENGSSASSVEEFRYARDLVSAEECEAWLEGRGLEYSDLVGHFERTLANEVISTGRAHVVAVLLSDNYVDHLRRFAHAIAFAVDMDIFPPAQVLVDQGQVGGWYSQAIAWCRIQAPPFLHARAQARARRDLTTIHFIDAELHTADAAQEAILCIRQDEQDLLAVARMFHFPNRIIEARAGSLAGPLFEVLNRMEPLDAEHWLDETGARHVLQLLARRVPLISDPAVQVAIDAHLAQCLLDPLACRHIATFPSLLIA